MKIFLRIFLTLIFLIVLGLAGFYFWASSPNLKVHDYAGVTIHTRHTETIKEDTLSIITFNIGYLSGMTNNQPVIRDLDLFKVNLTNVINLLNDFQPTFLGLQEVDFSARRSFYNNQKDSIADMTGFTHAAHVVNWDKRYVPFPYWPPQVHFGEMLSGQAVLSKYPVLSNRRIVLPKPRNNSFYYNAFYLDRLIQVVEVDLGDQILVIINVHLEAYDKITREIQSEIVKDITEKYVYDFPLLLIGDFNSKPPVRILKNLEEQTIANILSLPGIQMALKELDYEITPEDHYTYTSRDPFEKIDYIFYNDQIVPVESYVIRSSGEISDHLPVYFKFIIKND